MRFFLTLAAISIGAVFIGCGSRSMQNIENPVQVSASPDQNDTERQPVLVELFTSEGCSSCPPADRQLTFLETQQPVSGAEVITLAFHVDYWDRLGWKDAFSSAAYSKRQNDYAIALKLDSNYTPQMIVDGEQQFVGSNGAKASEAITSAAANTKGKVTLGIVGRTVKIDIDQIQKHENATVYLAAAESAITTNVRAGENSGQTLSHTSVVRDLREIGGLPASESSYTANIELPYNSAWTRENLRYVVFVQENASRRVLAVGRADAE